MIAFSEKIKVLHFNFLQVFNPPLVFDYLQIIRFLQNLKYSSKNTKSQDTNLKLGPLYTFNTILSFLNWSKMFVCEHRVCTVGWEWRNVLFTTDTNQG